MSGLRWEEQYPECWWAFSGDLRVGMLVQRNDGVYVYSVDAVHTKYIAKGHGEVALAASGKKAVEKAWAKWLNYAGLCKAATDA